VDGDAVQALRITFKVEILVGEQPAIVNRDLFEAVQAKLTEQMTSHEQSRTRSEALLLGRIYDDRGHPMSPSHVRKRGIKYRYYISTALLQGRPKQVGTVSRVPAKEVEDLVAKAVRDHFKEPTEIPDAVLIHKYVARAEIQGDQIFIELAVAKAANSKRKKNDPHGIEVSWRKTSSTRRREVVMPETGRPRCPPHPL
jgi:site-specific DNA recombinase